MSGRGHVEVWQTMRKRRSTGTASFVCEIVWRGVGIWLSDCRLRGGCRRHKRRWTARLILSGGNKASRRIEAWSARLKVAERILIGPVRTMVRSLRRRTGFLLPFALDWNAVRDTPQPAFAIFLHLLEGLQKLDDAQYIRTAHTYRVLTKIVPDAALPAITGHLKLEEWPPPFYCAVYLLEIELLGL